MTENDTIEQKKMCRDAFKMIAECNSLFMEMLKGPNPLTKAEIRKLIAKRPELWGRFSKFAE
jgi:hypothetical protein